MSYQVVGGQRFPHKYKRRFRKDGKWAYVYADDEAKSFKQAVEGADEYKLVIAQGKPTTFMVDGASMIVFGPPQTLGRKLFINQNPRKSYFGTARTLDGAGTPVYLYTEAHLKRAEAKKAAKFIKSVQAIKLLNNQAEHLMYSPDPVDRQYGLVMWLNNKTGLRIGAHEDAASVDPKERAAIIAQAKKENWTEREKQQALEGAKKPTFGLLTSRVAHVKLDPRTQIASWNFRGKGGKMITEDNVSVKLDHNKYGIMSELLHGRDDGAKVFEDVDYKRVWRMYKRHEITPHFSRDVLAEGMIKSLMHKYKAGDDESGRGAEQRFNREVESKISNKLGHTRTMTEKSYISTKTRNALAAFREALRQHAMKEADQQDNREDLARVVIWLDIGPGNEVI